MKSERKQWSTQNAIAKKIYFQKKKEKVLKLTETQKNLLIIVRRSANNKSSKMFSERNMILIINLDLSKQTKNEGEWIVHKSSI